MLHQQLLKQTKSTMSQLAPRQRRIELHFDLNRTILMSDAAGGRNMEDTVNYLLSECVWGRVSDVDNAAKWSCLSPVPSTSKPAMTKETVESASSGSQSNDEDAIMTYKSFVDKLFPYQTLHQDAKSVDQVKAFNKAAKKQRTKLQAQFTNVNAPGAAVAPAFQQVMQKLHFEDPEARQKAMELAQTLPKANQKLAETWQSGRLYLLPSFINLLFFLAQRNGTTRSSKTVDEHPKEAPELEFQLVLRTFGDDAVDVAKEIEFLVNGTHPLCQGRKLPECFRLSQQAMGTFYRHGFDSQGTVLALGTLTKVPFDSTQAEDDDSIRAFYGQSDASVQLVRGFDAIQSRLHQLYQQHAVVALRDYWEWWNIHGEDERYGKLLLVDEEDEAQAIFFDDHIEHTHAHIVDVRDVTSGDPVAFDKANDRFLHRVEPFWAITDTEYFVNQVQSLLHGRTTT